MGIWTGLWDIEISMISHNDLGGLQGGQAGEYYHLTLSEYNQLPVYDAHILDSSIHFTEASLNLPTTYLKLDCSNDPLTGQLDSQSIVPNITSIYDLGDSSNFFRTLYLDNDGGNIIFCPNVATGEGPTEYTIWGGGGNFGAEQNQGGIFRIKMNTVGTSLGTSTNQIIFDPGTPDWAAAAGHNDVIFEAFNGISTYSFVFEFGGFNNPEYGMQLRRTTGAELSGKSLIFDNQTPVSDFRRSIDFRINSINQMTIENTGEVIIINRITAPRADITAIQSGSGFGNAGVQAVGATSYLNFFSLNWFDYLTFNAQSTNLPVCLGLFPNGTSTSSYVNVYNSSNTGATAWLELGVRGSIAELVVRDYSQTTNITDLNIGSGGNDFPVFDVTCTTLTDINLVFAGVTYYNFTSSLLTFSDAVNIAFNTVTGSKIGTSTSQKLAFFNSTPIVQPSSTGQTAGHTGGVGANIQVDSTFTGGVGATAYTIGDIIRHLKNLGLIAV